ncbi:MAG TPA: transglutaminase domain-containing protein [Methanobacterium sp.]|nr:transglutaminase domain-containing protein [Methanobacterium sp.]
MKRLMLLAVLLIYFGALFNATNIYAATENSQTSDNTTNETIALNNTTNNQNSSNIQNSMGNATEDYAGPVNDSSTKNLQTSQNTSNSSENYESNDSTSNLTNVQDSNDAAGDDVYQNVHGIWLKAEDVGILNLDEIKGAGITDIFFKTNILTVPTYQTVLQSLLDKLKNTNIRVHAWITCFKDANGNWIDPQGSYNYTVKVPYVVKKYQTKTKQWYKYWYKSRGKWTYKWKYKWVYQWNYQYAYKDEVRTGYNTTKVDSLIASIADITRNYDIDGIHLDYVRYPGTAYKYVNGTETITSFVKRVYETVKQIKPKVAVSAALMPEGSQNAYYYGQDYAKLAPYLDFLVPMIYKGNYKKDTAWIGSTTKWIVEHSGGKPVLAGLQTYESDSDFTELPADELKGDVKSAINNGASGYVLFRYGLTDNDFFKSTSQNSVSFSINSILGAATNVKSFIDSNSRLPNYVQIDSTQVSMSEMLRIMSVSVLQLSTGIKTPVTFKDVDTATNSTGSIVSGNVTKTEFLDIAQRIKSFIDSNGIAPNYVTSSLGKMQYESTIYMMAKVLDFYNTNNRLPSYVSMDSWKVSSDPIPDDLQKYLQKTANCQVDDYRIKALAASLTNGVSSTYDKGVKIFNWVRDNLGYSFYYNTQYGAVGTLNAKTGNCVDTSHLMIALARAAGIPARYMHGTATFTSGNVYGHVWAQFYINGKWYDADGTSSKNSFGVIKNWNTSTVIMKGIYAELPF